MPSQVTFTGAIGPGRSLATQIFQDVLQVNFQLDREVLQIVQPPNKITELEIFATTTVTDTITSGNHAFVVSQ